MAPGERTSPAASRAKRLLKPALQLGFLFFLLKGIGWLVLGWLAWAKLT
jgi:hypothetical protein